MRIGWTMARVFGTNGFRPVAESLLVAAGLLAVSGCSQGLGGGASSLPAVRILPDADAQQTSTGSTASGSQTVAGYGTLRGRVVIDGAPPALPATIQQSQIKPADAAICVFEKIPRQENLIVGADGALQNVFVYLPKSPAGAQLPSGPLPEIAFDQKVCMFVPRCLVAMAGQTVMVLNSDNLAHNTHTFPSRNPQFNTTVSTGKGVPLVYSRSEQSPVRVVCDFHPWMGAYHLPLDHPYGAVSGPDGRFEIAGLPAGRHEFTVWHEAAGRVDNKLAVDIPVDGVAEIEIKVPSQSLAAFSGPPVKRVVLSALP